MAGTTVHDVLKDILEGLHTLQFSVSEILSKFEKRKDTSRQATRILYTNSVIEIDGKACTPGADEAIRYLTKFLQERNYEVGIPLSYSDLVATEQTGWIEQKITEILSVVRRDYLKNEVGYTIIVSKGGKRYAITISDDTGPTTSDTTGKRYIRVTVNEYVQISTS